MNAVVALKFGIRKGPFCDLSFENARIVRRAAIALQCARRKRFESETKPISDGTKIKITQRGNCFLRWLAREFTSYYAARQAIHKGEKKS